MQFNDIELNNLTANKLFTQKYGVKQPFFNVYLNVNIRNFELAVF